MRSGLWYFCGFKENLVKNKSNWNYIIKAILGSTLDDVLNRINVNNGFKPPNHKKKTFDLSII